MRLHQPCFSLSEKSIPSLSGRSVERQELVLPFDGTTTPDLFLAQVGVALLLDRLPKRP